MDRYAILYLAAPLLAFAYGALMVLKSYKDEVKKISEEADGDKYRPEASRGKVMMLIMQMATALVFLILAFRLILFYGSSVSLLIMGSISVINILCQIPLSLRAAKDVAYNPNPALLPDEIRKMPYSPEGEKKKREYYESIGMREDANSFGKRLIQISIFEMPLIFGFLLFFDMLHGEAITATSQYIFLLLSAAAIPGALKISQLPLTDTKDFSRSLMTAMLAISPSLIGFLYAFIVPRLG